MSEIEEMGRFEQGVWIPQPKLIEVQLTTQDNIWMIIMRLEKVESHLYRIEQMLNVIETELRWRR